MLHYNNINNNIKLNFQVFRNPTYTLLSTVYFRKRKFKTKFKIKKI